MLSYETHAHSQTHTHIYVLSVVNATKDLCASRDQNRIALHANQTDKIAFMCSLNVLLDFKWVVMIVKYIIEEVTNRYTVTL